MDIREVERFFSEAALNTWAGREGERQGERIVIPEFPGAKAWRFSKEPLVYTDMYVVSLSGDHGAGQTIISCEGTPVWIMQYRGHYQERVIPFLKEALTRQYATGVFYGGRGPLAMSSGYGLVYVNRPTKNAFSDFEGHEQITRDPLGAQVLKGIHWYAGHSLL